MNTKAPLRTVGKALGVASRSTPVAGPSRIPFRGAGRRSFATTNVRREPVTEICARTATPMASILDGLAILRAVEAQYGQVIDFSIFRDPESLQPNNLVFLTLLDPVELGSKRHIHEIPAPQSELGNKQIYGGPSLADVQAVLSPSGTPRRLWRNPPPSDRVITFEVEVRRTAARTRSSRDPTVKKITEEMIREDEKILDALEPFGDGFYGGFEGVAAKHRKVLEGHKAQLGGKKGAADTSETKEARDTSDIDSALPTEAEPIAAKG